MPGGGRPVFRPAGKLFFGGGGDGGVVHVDISAGEELELSLLVRKGPATADREGRRGRRTKS